MEKSIKEIAEETGEAAKLFARNETDLLKLRVARWMSHFTANITTFLVLMLTMVLLLFFVGMASALALQAWFSPPVSYLIVSGGIALFALVFIIGGRKLLADMVMREVIKEIFDES
jgi:hypothetical protein